MAKRTKDEALHDLGGESEFEKELTIEYDTETSSVVSTEVQETDYFDEQVERSGVKSATLEDHERAAELRHALGSVKRRHLDAQIRDFLEAPVGRSLRIKDADGNIILTLELDASGNVEFNSDDNIEFNTSIYDKNGDEILGVPPIGSTYIQFPGESAPGTLWSSTTWQKLFDDEGVFFRTEDGEVNASAFESGVQADATAVNGLGVSHNADRITSADFGNDNSGPTRPHALVKYANASISLTGDSETRPTNRTIRVWERIA